MAKLNWPAIDSKLPLGLDPDSREVRFSLFDSLNTGGKKTLSLAEIDQGIRDLLVDFEGNSLVPSIRELGGAIACAFKAARELAPSKRQKKKTKPKASKAKVDKSEFHAFLVAFRLHLELAELFEVIDDKNEDDQKLSHRECLKSLSVLEEWGIDAEKLQEKFKGVDVWVSTVDFNDFADWCIESKWHGLELRLDDSDNELVVKEKVAYEAKGSGKLSIKEEACKVRELFKKFDVDNSGTIGEHEMSALLLALDSGLKESQLKMLYEVADSNSDGLVDYEEFCKFVFGE